MYWIHALNGNLLCYLFKVKGGSGRIYSCLLARNPHHRPCNSIASGPPLTAATAMLIEQNGKGRAGGEEREWASQVHGSAGNCPSSIIDNFSRRNPILMSLKSLPCFYIFFFSCRQLSRAYSSKLEWKFYNQTSFLLYVRETHKTTKNDQEISSIVRNGVIVEAAGCIQE